jgi:hypothetical protein
MWVRGCQIIQYTSTTTAPAGPMTNVVIGGGMYGPGPMPGSTVSPAYVPASAYPPRPTAATSGLMPGAERYYSPYVKPGEDVAAPGDADGGPMSAWGDLLERMTRELSTDTMEIANLDNQVLILSSRSTAAPKLACLLAWLASLPCIALTRAASGGVWWGLVGSGGRYQSTTPTTRCCWLSTRQSSTSRHVLARPDPRAPRFIEIP